MESVLSTFHNLIFQFSQSHPNLVAAIGTAAVTYGFLWALLHSTQDAREPPLLLGAIPFISPVIGMVKWSMDFYVQLKDENPNSSIYTLRLPGFRLYIVNSTALILEVQRKWRTFVFSPVPARASEYAMGGSKEAMDIIRAGMSTDADFMHGFNKAIHPALSSGPALENLTGRALEVIAESLDDMVKQGGKEVKMFDWIRHDLLMATTDSVYGRGNPLRDPQNEKAWQKFHPSIMFLLLNVLPQWVFRDAIKARGVLAKAFLHYHAEGQYKEGSVYIRRWTEYCVSHGIPVDDIAKFHNAGLFALIANTIPTAFWMIFRVFSDPSVVSDCRDEISRSVEERDGVCTINVGRIKADCPTLVSTFQEVFRVHGLANSVRVATEDHYLDNGKYLIKKGGLVMMPARVQHHLRDVWGNNVDEFDHRRFINKEGDPQPNAAAFRGFGGGTTLCPGRHFATTEILVLTAMLLLRFDLVPLSGRWVLPSTKNSSQAEAMEQPDYDIDIQLRPRSGAEKKWRVSFAGAGDTALVAEDLRG
ncbi:cytochrome P450 [Cercophora scortea]|uniref:Cytochrome P450 n=1 Tax=Cercophora scortea TaxID=314031 RepID=A0AAE0IHK2_9PEZI|nr:cytochrome P450 [Cercophora scortea]